MKSYFIVVLAFAVGVNCSSIRSRAQKPKLHFNDIGKFKIVHFTDLHYSEGSFYDDATTKMIGDILDWEHPEFVAFTGDLVSEEWLVAPNGSAYLEQMLQPLVQRNYSWGSTYGNHDSGPILTREELLATEQKYPNCYTEHGEEGLVGITNYYVPVYPPVGQGSDDIPAAILWFFDSRGGRSADEWFPSSVDATVVEWFKQKSAEMTAEWGPIPALAYFHHATKEYMTVHENIAQKPECTGLKDIPEDELTPHDPETGLVEALAASGVVKATFVGHHHGHGWCCSYEQMALCFNRHSGRGGWWAGGEWVRGARVVELSYDAPWGSDANYVRLEYGRVIDHFVGPSRDQSQ